MAGSGAYRKRHGRQRSLKKHAMRILILADIDELHWPAGGGKADLLLSCGDLFDQVIVEAAQAYHCPQIFAVKATTIRTAPSCRRSRISICGCAIMVVCVLAG